MRVSMKAARVGLRNSETRIPFRYGKACLTRCPQAILEVTIEADGRRQAGYSGDCLPPSWFDKTPGKGFAQQIAEMLAVIALSQEVFLEEFSISNPRAFFPGWLAAYERIHRRAAEWQLPPLLISFGVSLLERAIMDAMARAAHASLAQAVRSNLFAIEAGEVHRELDDLQPADWLPPVPRDAVFVRHTVGLGDPLTEAEISPGDRLGDGFPQALEQYVKETGLSYFKIKVSNNLDLDLQRLRTIASLVERHRGSDYRVTLDGNEQYGQAAEFDELIASIQADRSLSRLWQNTLVIEQPLDRAIALDEAHTGGIRQLAKPVIIDESDGTLDAFARAVELGYRGVSSKNCKGPVKSLLNAGLAWWLNGRGTQQHYLMTAEDLCTVGTIPVQSDLCLVATLGLDHVERNGHHFHPGLSYLPPQQQQAALEAHPDFYCQHAGRIAPHLIDGRFRIASLQCEGYGFGVLPDWSAWQSPEQWEYASLGLDEGPAQQ